MDSLGLTGLKAIRALKNDSRKAVQEAQIQQAQALKELPQAETPVIKNEDNERRKEQLRIGKFFFEFHKEEVPGPDSPELEVRGRGRPKKDQDQKAKNITISLSRSEREQLDGLNGLGKGRGSRVAHLMNYYAKHEQRKKDQARAIKEALRVVGTHIDSYARNYKRAEKFDENEQTLEELDRATNSLRIVLNLLKFDDADLKACLTPQEYSHYQFALNFASNRKGDQ